MAQAAGGMVYDSVDAYVRQDLDLARAVRRRDDVVDSLFLQVRQELTARIAARPAGGEEALDLLMAATYLERVGDHATNLAEWVEFSITGQHPQGNQGMTTGGAE
jgi:phosphate transport system protein